MFYLWAGYKEGNGTQLPSPLESEIVNFPLLGADLASKWGRISPVGQCNVDIKTKLTAQLTFLNTLRGGGAGEFTEHWFISVKDTF